MPKDPPAIGTALAPRPPLRFFVRRPQPNPAAAARACRPFSDHLDAGVFQRAHHLHKRIDAAADDAVACFHALDRGHREPAQLGKAPLADAEQRAGGAKLGCGDQRGNLSGSSQA